MKQEASPFREGSSHIKEMLFFLTFCEQDSLLFQLPLEKLIQSISLAHLAL